MNFLFKFGIIKPILSFDGRNDSLEDPLVKLYYVHAKAVKQCTSPDLRWARSAPHLLPTALKSALVASTSVICLELEHMVAREVQTLFGSGWEAVKECFK